MPQKSTRLDVSHSIPRRTSQVGRFIITQIANRFRNSRRNAGHTQLDPTNPEIIKNRGITHLNLGETEKAIADFRTALSRDTDHADEYRRLLGAAFATSAVKHNDSERLEAAIADMNRAIENDPKPDYFHRRASMFFNDKRFTKALDNWTEAVRLAPSNSVFHEHRGYALEALGRKVEAEVEYGNAGELTGAEDR